MDIIAEINRLKKEKDATLIAHYYQPIEVQKCADYIGDSLGLAKMAKDNISAKHLVFAGVKFMGETAAILNPDKKILLPDMNAGCPMANFLTAEKVRQYKQAYPGIPIILYVNTTAESKSEVDMCCTSSNALKMVTALAEKHNTDTILFGPDKNLAEYVRRRTNLNIITIPENGCCPRHDILTLDQLKIQKQKYPNAVTIVHPECKPEIQDNADFIGSTAGMLNYVKQHPEISEFIVGTEVGLIDHLRWKLPNQTYYPADERMLCKNMKKITIEKVLATFQAIGDGEKEAQFLIGVPEKIAQKALFPINDMINLS